MESAIRKIQQVSILLGLKGKEVIGEISTQQSKALAILSEWCNIDLNNLYGRTRDRSENH